MRSRVAAVTFAVVVVVATVFGISAVIRQLRPEQHQLAAAKVVTPAGLSWLSWELIDRKSGKVLGESANAQSATDYAESMIKVWLAADFLSRHKPSATDLRNLEEMIVLSDDDQANHYYDADGRSGSIDRMDHVCHLGDTPIADADFPWSTVQITASQAAHVGECIADGAAAGAYTQSLLTWMTRVEGGVTDQPDPPFGNSPTGGGRWGIIDGLPSDLAGQAAIKNGWEPENLNHAWNINCLAILPGQVLAVELQYPWTAAAGHTSYQYANNLAVGAQACADVTRQLVTIMKT